MSAAAEAGRRLAREHTRQHRLTDEQVDTAARILAAVARERAQEAVMAQDRRTQQQRLHDQAKASVDRKQEQPRPRPTVKEVLFGRKGKR